MGSWPLWVIVLRGMLYAAHARYVGEDKHSPHATASHGCTTLAQTARPWPRHLASLDTPEGRHALYGARGYAATAPAWPCDGSRGQATYACFAPRLLIGQRVRQTYDKGVVLQAGETTLDRCQHTGYITPEQGRDIKPQTGKSLTAQ
jgi:hypothetical protein